MPWNRGAQIFADPPHHSEQPSLERKKTATQTYSLPARPAQRAKQPSPADREARQSQQSKQRSVALSAEHSSTETMPIDACQFFYACPNCRASPRPLPGGYCVSLLGSFAPAPEVGASREDQASLRAVGVLVFRVVKERLITAMATRSPASATTPNAIECVGLATRAALPAQATDLEHPLAVTRVAAYHTSSGHPRFRRRRAACDRPRSSGLPARRLRLLSSG